MTRKILALILSLAMLAAFGCAFAEETAYVPGPTVTADPESPTGYTVTFVFTTDDTTVTGVQVSGPFAHVDPNQPLAVENRFTPREYAAGQYASNMTGPSIMESTWGYNEDMVYDEEAGVWTLSFPITSGSYAYSYILTHEDGTTETICDPANPSPSLLNPNSDIATGDITHSIVYGCYDEEKQAGSPNLDFVLPSENYGELRYVEYAGVLSDHQDMGIYLPAGYDAEREEPYKVIYLSHGGGGNETDWFAMGHADNIIANLGLDVIVVTLDHNSFAWDFAQIGDNMINYVIPYMEANYNVSTEASGRAFAGLSMGSMTTFHMFFEHADVFGYYGAFSGPDMSVVDADAEGIHEPVFYFTVGTEDIASERIAPNGEGQQIKYENFVTWLAEHPMDNVIDGGYVPGAHDWFTWSQSLYTFASEICFK